MEKEKEGHVLDPTISHWSTLGEKCEASALMCKALSMKCKKCAEK